VRIFAGADLVGLNASLPKASEIEAQGTIHDATVSIQHFRETDRSLIKAGQNIEGILNSQGGASDSSAVTVSGPGQLFMEAGHNLNLNTSGGVISLGNITNNLLPDVSARLSLLAGGSKAVSLSEFQSLYLSGNPAAQSALIDYVRTVLKLDGGALSGPDGYSQALVYYAQMSAPHQVAFANKVMDQRFVDAFLAPGKPYASAWQAVAKAANVSPTDLGSNAFLRFKDDVLMSEVARLGTAATKIADSTDATVNAENRAARQVLWDELNMAVSMAGLGKGFVRTGDINVAASKVQTRAPGDKTVGGIDLFAPGGNVVVGLTANDVKGQGVVTQSGGNVRSVLQGDFQVNSQKAFVVGVGDLTIYASTGFIDSGRGSNTSVSSPPAIGKFVGDYPVYVPGATITGSGLAILPLPDGRRDGKMKLLAPVGGVVLLDTYIRAPEIEVAGPVKGGDNFKSASVTSTVAVAAPSTIGNQATAPTTAPAAGAVDAAESGRVARKSKSSLLTVELLSIGGEAPAAGNTPDDKACADKDCAKK
jgi:filamentous hemagglutinin